MTPPVAIDKRFRWYRAKLLRRLCNFDPLANLLVCGGPRSGSTWLAELIASMPGTALLFEPLTSTEFGPFRDLNFARDQPIPEDAEWPEARAAFASMLCGKAISDWNITYSRSSSASFLSARRLVVKCCHANMLLPWLVRQFAFQCPPVFLVRHPFAVVASQLKHGNWAFEFKGFRIPDCRFNESYVRHKPFLLKLETKVEALTAQWCLANRVPLESARNDRDWITVHYEQMLLEPQKELERIFRRWGLPLPNNIADRIHRPSATAANVTFTKGSEAQLAKWRHAFSADELKKMRDVLDYFSISTYGEDPFPARAATVKQPSPRAAR